MNCNVKIVKDFNVKDVKSVKDVHQITTDANIKLKHTSDTRANVIHDKWDRKLNEGIDQ